MEPEYNKEGIRLIKPRNINTSRELNQALNDINLTVFKPENGINVYCEDEHAASFVKFLLNREMEINIELYMQFVSVNLGWSNYIQLYERNIPEFRNNIILLDADVPKMKEYKKKRQMIEEADNITFLPVEIEKGIFALLKDYGKFNEFQEKYSNVSALNYDICFNEWAWDINKYESVDFKNWFTHMEAILGDRTILFRFWMDKNQEKVDTFLNNFVHIFNVLAEQLEIDTLPVL